MGRKRAVALDPAFHTGLSDRTHNPSVELQGIRRNNFPAIAATHSLPRGDAGRVFDEPHTSVAAQSVDSAGRGEEGDRGPMRERHELDCPSRPHATWCMESSPRSKRPAAPRPGAADHKAA
jgi:hypothetical protein